MPSTNDTLACLDYDILMDEPTNLQSRYDLLRQKEIHNPKEISAGNPNDALMQFALTLLAFFKDDDKSFGKRRALYFAWQATNLVLKRTDSPAVIFVSLVLAFWCEAHKVGKDFKKRRRGSSCSSNIDSFNNSDRNSMSKVAKTFFVFMPTINEPSSDLLAEGVEKSWIEQLRGLICYELIRKNRDNLFDKLFRGFLKLGVFGRHGKMRTAKLVTYHLECIRNCEVYYYSNNWPHSYQPDNDARFIAEKWEGNIPLKAPAPAQLSSGPVLEVQASAPAKPLPQALPPLVSAQSRAKILERQAVLRAQAEQNLLSSRKLRKFCSEQNNQLKYYDLFSSKMNIVLVFFQLGLGASLEAERSAYFERACEQIREMMVGPEAFQPKDVKDVWPEIYLIAAVLSAYRLAQNSDERYRQVCRAELDQALENFFDITSARWAENHIVDSLVTWVKNGFPPLSRYCVEEFYGARFSLALDWLNRFGYLIIKNFEHGATRYFIENFLNMANQYQHRVSENSVDAVIDNVNQMLESLLRSYEQQNTKASRIALRQAQFYEDQVKAKRQAEIQHYREVYAKLMGEWEDYRYAVAKADAGWQEYISAQAQVEAKTQGYRDALAQAQDKRRDYRDALAQAEAECRAYQKAWFELVPENPCYIQAREEFESRFRFCENAINHFKTVVNSYNKALISFQAQAQAQAQTQNPTPAQPPSHGALKMQASALAGIRVQKQPPLAPAQSRAEAKQALLSAQKLRMFCTEQNNQEEYYDLCSSKMNIAFFCFQSGLEILSAQERHAHFIQARQKIREMMDGAGAFRPEDVWPEIYLIEAVLSAYTLAQESNENYRQVRRAELDEALEKFFNITSARWAENQIIDSLITWVETGFPPLSKYCVEEFRGPRFSLALGWLNELGRLITENLDNTAMRIFLEKFAEMADRFRDVLISVDSVLERLEQVPQEWSAQASGNNYFAEPTRFQEERVNQANSNADVAAASPDQTMSHERPQLTEGSGQVRVVFKGPGASGKPGVLPAASDERAQAPNPAPVQPPPDGTSEEQAKAGVQALPPLVPAQAITEQSRQVSNAQSIGRQSVSNRQTPVQAPAQAHRQVQNQNPAPAQPSSPAKARPERCGAASSMAAMKEGSGEQNSREAQNGASTWSSGFHGNYSDARIPVTDQAGPGVLPPAQPLGTPAESVMSYVVHCVESGFKIYHESGKRKKCFIAAAHQIQEMVVRREDWPEIYLIRAVLCAYIVEEDYEMSDVNLYLRKLREALTSFFKIGSVGSPPQKEIVYSLVLWVKNGFPPLLDYRVEQFPEFRLNCLNKFRNIIVEKLDDNPSFPLAIRNFTLNFYTICKRDWVGWSIRDKIPPADEILKRIRDSGSSGPALSGDDSGSGVHLRPR